VELGHELAALLLNVRLVQRLLLGRARLAELLRGAVGGLLLLLLLLPGRRAGGGAGGRAGRGRRAGAGAGGQGGGAQVPVDAAADVEQLDVVQHVGHLHS
jgi:hypothetical protein